ncbi:MAG: ribonuclease P protein component [Ureaplasma sp.]|nr:ribonuclease P protein component [Ureaplasma sp.]MDE7221701.1 ribonuclease P protein component [Ureaplasma sp.]
MRKEYRLCKSEVICDVLQSNNKLFCKVANVYYKSNNLDKPQIAIIASKKKFNLAVTRNKIKRQVRSILLEWIIKLNTYNIVIVVKQDWLKFAYIENKNQLENLLRRICKKESKNNEFTN